MGGVDGPHCTQLHTSNTHIGKWNKLRMEKA
jgi:hypothetical protein